jgi:L-ascorbate metabolism protein UlaG (beta-lactamase superfamily)
MNKSDRAGRLDGPDVSVRPRISRRRWLGATLGAGVGAAAAEAASLSGTWDHARASQVEPATGAAHELEATGAAHGLEAGTVALDGAAGPRLTHLGHSCHLLEIGGQRWLTDPWFFDPAFGSLWHRVAREASSIGRLDGIFISHRHADHFDPTALRLLDKRAQVWVADESLLAPLEQMQFSRVQLSSPWRALEMGGLTLAFAPALHDVPQHSLLLLAADARLLFCADTGYHAHFAEIRRRYRPTAALLPCDGTALRWEPRQIMNPEEAARAAIELGCQQVMPTHSDAAYSDLLARHVLSTSVPDPVAALGAALAAARTAPGHGGPARVPALHPLRIGECRALGA